MRTCGNRAPVGGLRALDHPRESTPLRPAASAARLPPMSAPPVLVVFGARNVGRAVVADRLAAGWRALAVARVGRDARRPARGAPGRRGRCGATPATTTWWPRRSPAPSATSAGSTWWSTRPPRCRATTASAAARSPRRRPSGSSRGWPASCPPPGRSCAAPGAALERRGAGTLVQISGGSARRAMPGRGPWAAAQFGARALTHALAQELRPRGRARRPARGRRRDPDRAQPDGGPRRPRSR